MFRKRTISAKKKKNGEIIEPSRIEYVNEGPAMQHAKQELRDVANEYAALAG